MKLQTEAGTSIDAPSDSDLVRELATLSFPANKFAILKKGELFIQAYRNEDDTFTLEHSEGSVDRMFQYESATLEQARDVMQLFLKGDDYRAALPFQPFTF